jgi:hypothetical protein
MTAVAWGSSQSTGPYPDVGDQLKNNFPWLLTIIIIVVGSFLKVDESHER